MGEYLLGLASPAREVDASAVPAFDPPTFSNGGGSTYLTRDVTFVSDATDPEAVAHEIDGAPPEGFVSEGVGGHRNADGSWSQDLYLYPTPGNPDPHEHAGVTVSVTPAEAGVGILVEAGSAYRAQRTLDSAVALDGSTTAVVHRNDVGGSVVDPDELSRLVERFNALSTWPEFFHSCPYDAAPDVTVRLSSSLGTLEATWSDCYRAWEVRSGSRRLLWLDDSGDDPLVDLVEQLARRVG